jgi:hypothetical protein
MRYKNGKTNKNALVFLLMFLITTTSSYAQGAMCRAVLITEEGGVKANGCGGGEAQEGHQEGSQETHPCD